MPNIFQDTYLGVVDSFLDVKTAKIQDRRKNKRKNHDPVEKHYLLTIPPDPVTGHYLI